MLHKVKNRISDYYVDLKFSIRLRRGKVPFPAQPMIEDDLLRYFLAQKSKDRDVLEFGSGASTLYLSGLFREIHSVETSRSWAKSVATALEKAGITNVNLSVAQIGLTGQGGIPIFKSLNKIFWASNRRYATKPFTENSFDLIFVDGRFRLACFVSAALYNRRTHFSVIFDDYFDARNVYSGILESKGLELRRVGRAAVVDFSPEVLRELQFSKSEIREAFRNYN